MDPAYFLKSIKGTGLEDIERSIEYLNNLQKSKNVTPPPLIQIITIIKYERPVLYSTLKQRLQNNIGMKLLFNLDFDYEQARLSLKLE